MFSSLNLNRYKTALQAVSFGVLFFGSEASFYLKKERWHLDAKELLTLILAMTFVSVFFYSCIKMYESLINKKYKHLFEGVFLFFIYVLFWPFLFDFNKRSILFLMKRSVFLDELGYFNLLNILFSLYLFFCLISILFFTNFSFRFHRKVLLFFSPFLLTFPFFLGKISLKEISTDKLFSQKKIEQANKDRIFLIIMDEWDPTVFFREELKELFPATHRWRNQSFYASQAYPAGTDTCYSIISMTLGKFVNQVEEKNKLHSFQYADGSEGGIWEERKEGLFRELFEKGIRIGCVGGFYMDYAKRFAPWIVARSLKGSHTFLESFSEHFLRSFYCLGKNLHSKFFDGLITRFNLFLKNSSNVRFYDLIQNSSCDFIFAHFQGGHYPSLEVYPDENGVNSYRYLASLKTVDQFLDQFESFLKKENIWNSSTIIITSDHWWRLHAWKTLHFQVCQEEHDRYLEGIDHRVPLFIKLKNQKRGFEYDRETSTIFLKELVHQLVDGSIDSIESVESFFDHKRISSPSDIRKWEELKY